MLQNLKRTSPAPFSFRPFWSLPFEAVRHVGQRTLLITGLQRSQCGGLRGASSRDYTDGLVPPAHREDSQYAVEQTKNATARPRNRRRHLPRHCRPDRRRVGDRADDAPGKTPSCGRGLQERPGAQGNSRGRIPGDDGDHGGRASVRLLGLSRQWAGTANVDWAADTPRKRRRAGW